MYAIFEKIIPAIGWIRSYERAHLRGDITAGITTAVMIIPQGIAYAMLAGLPPIMGLYAAIIPLLVYAIFGTSRQLAVGPAAMDSLLVFATLSAIAKVGTDQYVFFAIALAFIAGSMQVLMGIVRLGFIVEFLSKPVISGFTAAAALVIGFSQLKDLLGIEIERTHHIHIIIVEALQNFTSISILTLAFGLAGIGIMHVLKKKKPNFPRALAIVVLGALATYFFDLSNFGLAVVGSVPAGFPAITIPNIDLEVFQTLLPSAAVVALIGFMEAISIAKGFASKYEYEVDPNQELIAIGLANVAAGMVQGFTVTGGFSRSAVNDSAGAKTPLSSMITAGIVALALMFFTPLFQFLPRTIMAAIIISAVFGLIDIPLVRHFWKTEKTNFVLYFITFVATLAFGIVAGLSAGLGASVCVRFAFKKKKSNEASPD